MTAGCGKDISSLLPKQQLLVQLQLLRIKWWMGYYPACRLVLGAWDFQLTLFLINRETSSKKLKMFPSSLIQNTVMGRDANARSIKALNGYLCKNMEVTAKFSKLKQPRFLRFTHVSVQLPKRTGHGQTVFRDVSQVCETRL